MNIEADFNYRKPLKENEAKPAFGLAEEDPQFYLITNHLKRLFMMLENQILTSQWVDLN